MVDINRNKIKKLDNRQDAKNVNTKSIHSSIENELYFIPLRNNVHKLKDPYTSTKANNKKNLGFNFIFHFIVTCDMPSYVLSCIIRSTHIQTY